MILNKRSYLSALVLMLPLLSACTKSPAVAGEGFFGLRISADTEILELTKAETVLDDDQASSYLLTLSQDGADLWSHTYEEFISGDYSKVPAGNYSLRAENITPEAALQGRGCVRVEASSDFSVRAGRTADVSLCCRCANAKASVDFDNLFSESFESGASVIFSDGKRMLEMPSGHSEANAAYFNCGEDGLAVVYYKLTATPAGGSSTEYRGTFSFPKGKWSKVVFSSGTVGEITVRIFADTSLREVEESESLDPMI